MNGYFVEGGANPPVFVRDQIHADFPTVRLKPDDIRVRHAKEIHEDGVRRVAHIGYVDVLK